MLQFVLGGAKTGKSTYIAEQIKLLSKKSNQKIILLVPEQFTFETEKKMFHFLGEKQFRNVDVTSFSRISTEIFKRYGGIAGQYANDSAKVVIMELALKELCDKLTVFNKSLSSKTFYLSMIDTVTEFKNAGVSPKDLLNCTDKMQEGFFKDKTKEIALIYETYNTMLNSTYLDLLDDISRAAEIVKDTDFFNGCMVFFDEFKGFTANEQNFIKLIFKKAEDVTFALCMDMKRAQANRIGVFSSVLDVYNKINRFARECGIGIKAPILLEESHFISPELCHMEKNLFSPVIEYSNKFSCNICAAFCKTEYEEADYVMSLIASLVQEQNYRYSEIAVITRDMDTYLTKLEAGFKKYCIPYYVDKTISIENKPLIRFVQNALDCVSKGFSAENVLALLKCGVLPFSFEEVSELENYVYVWDISSKQWNEPFCKNPRGFQEKISDEDKNVLFRINNIREFVISRLSELKKSVQETSGKQICAAIFSFLEKIEVRRKMEDIIKDLYEKENFDLAKEYGRVWDILMDILDTIAVASGNKLIRPQRFKELYELAVSSYDMGVLPQSIDTVIVGSADHIRTGEKRAVFILGVNENVFPYMPADSGVFTDRERNFLLNLDIDIAKPVKEKIKEERFITYKTLCSPSEKLYLTARKANIMGEEKAPSVIFEELRHMFGNKIVIDADDLSGEIFCKSSDAAFSFLAKNYLDDTPLTAALKNVFSKDIIYSKKLDGLDRVLENRSFSIKNKKNAISLFGRELNISPTRIESYYQCHFRYFMEQGLRVFPLKKAELDPLETGTLIHKILYIATQKMDMKEHYDQKLAKKIIKEELDDYIVTVMGGIKDKTQRFLYLYNRMQDSILKIVEQLHIELSQSSFVPCAFEYEIKKNADVTPLRLYGEDGAIINVAGKIDRVDCFVNKCGEKYIRIVDYKSGKKMFSLNDVLYGLNLQMLIYLHCISENGSGKFKNCLPAGILYMPVGEQLPVLSRDADEDTVKKQKTKNYAMNGLIINDRELIEAMDVSMSGIFIPVAMKKDGNFTQASKKSLVTLQELARINSYINRLIVNMASELHHGNVEAFPLEGSCVYCNYRGICGVTKASETKQYLTLDREAVLKEMEKSDAEA